MMMLTPKRLQKSPTMILSQGRRSAEKKWSESHPYVSQGVI
jgi:hypothetical protein